MKSRLLAILIFACPIISFADAWSCNGNVWSLMDQVQKLMYVEGAIDGISFVEDQRIGGVKVNTNFDRANYIARIDNYYSSPENIMIPAIWMIAVASLEMTGGEWEGWLSKIRSTFDRRQKRATDVQETD